MPPPPPPHPRAAPKMPILNRVNFSVFKVDKNEMLKLMHCVKIARTPSFSGPYFPTFGLNTKRYERVPHVLFLLIRLQLQKCFPFKMKTQLILFHLLSLRIL